jgi:hypothetical protein
MKNALRKDLVCESGVRTQVQFDDLFNGVMARGTLNCCVLLDSRKLFVHDVNLHVEPSSEPLNHDARHKTLGLGIDV